MQLKFVFVVNGRQLSGNFSAEIKKRLIIQQDLNEK